MPHTKTMSRDITQLHPELRQIIPQFLGQCEAVGLNVLITDCWRSREEQNALYCMGRTRPGSIVTNVAWPNSAHNWGVAFDFCRNEKGKEYDNHDRFFDRVGQIGKGLGLDWGGDWKSFRDMPHLQMAKYMPGNTTAWLKSKYKTPERFISTWPKLSYSEDDEQMRYATINDAPEYAYNTLMKLMVHGCLLGDGNPDLEKRVIDVNNDMIRILVVLDRIGCFRFLDEDGDK